MLSKLELEIIIEQTLETINETIYDINKKQNETITETKTGGSKWIN